MEKRFIQLNWQKPYKATATTTPVVRATCTSETAFCSPTDSFAHLRASPEVTSRNLKVEVPEDLAGRIQYQAYNFFTEQVVKNADVFILRTVIHDWPDNYAVQILRNQIPALRAGATILINDACIDASQRTTSMVTQAQWYVTTLWRKIPSDNWALTFTPALLT